jgi:hypothetical protein
MNSAGALHMSWLICARDALGHVETGESQKAWDDFIPRVCRGQRGGRRPSETGDARLSVS